MSEDKVIWFMAAPIPPGGPNRYLGLAFTSSPRFAVWDYSVPATPVLLSNPAILPTGAAQEIAFRGVVNLVCVAHATTPFISLYSIDNVTLTKIANPASLPLRDGLSCRFSTNRRYLAVGTEAGAGQQTLFFYDMITGSPVLVVGTPAFTTQIRNLSWDTTQTRCMVDTFIFDLSSGTPTLSHTLNTLSYNGSSWSEDGRYLCAVGADSPFIRFWDWDTGSPVQMSDPAVIPPAQGFAAAFDPTSDRLCMVTHNYPGMGPGNTTTRYDLASGVPVQIADATPVLSGGPETGLAYKNDGTLIAMCELDSPDNMTIFNNQVSPPAAIGGLPLAGDNALNTAWGGSA